MDSLDKEELQLDYTQEELVELISAKNAEIKKLKEELEKAKKANDSDELSKRADELLERIKAK